MHAELHMTKAQACVFRRLCCKCTLQHRVRHVQKVFIVLRLANSIRWMMPGTGVKGP